MRKLITIAVAITTAALMAVPAVASAQAKQHFGPYASNSPDSGTCGNTWANDTMNRDYQVDTIPNADGTYSVVESFKDGTFTTVPGFSPESCGNDPGGLLTSTITGTFQGSFAIVVYGGTYTPNAPCTQFCYTADFVNSHFPGNTGYNVTTYDLHYNAGSHGDWRDASANFGGDQGDITG